MQCALRFANGAFVPVGEHLSVIEVVCQVSASRSGGVVEISNGAFAAARCPSSIAGTQFDPAGTMCA